MKSAQTAVAPNVAQFTGSYLNRAWTRRYILGTLLQNYQPLAARQQQAAPLEEGSVSSSGGSSSSSSSSSGGSDKKKTAPVILTTVEDTRLDVDLLQAQRVLAGAWGLPVRPLDRTSEGRISRLLSRYACGEGQLSEEALDELNSVLSRINGAPKNVEDPRQMEKLLACVGYVRPGDNLRRVSYAGQLHYPPQALSLMEPFLSDKLQRDGGDAYDALRQLCDGPGYAIDSATTSEVDDAIGVEIDPTTGEEYFVVYVSDATVYCPFDSPLEQVTARALATTTYLPEGVFFMLPKPIVESATLRDDRPCRTFNIRFQIDEATGELKNYSVHVGWLKQLRRITYDQVQALLDARKSSPSGGAVGNADATNNNSAVHIPPAWLTEADTTKIARIFEVAQIRLNARLRRATKNNRAAIDSNLPEPLIKVRDTTVLSVTDQIVSTQDARLAVAELMIAANEACSRVAQAEGIPIPHRGTRSLSSDHEIARDFCEPEGVKVLSSLDANHVFMAEAMRRSMRMLSSVTRAIYTHLPLYHAGLDSSHYTHSTSPLRRYADMLVHHQLKVWLWRNNKEKQKKRQQGSGSAFMSHELIPEYNMASLCTMISTKQEQSALLQDGSSRYWLLRYLQCACEETRRQTGKEKLFSCLVGETRCVTAGTEYSRERPAVNRSLSALCAKDRRDTLEATDDTSREASGGYSYVSELYLPEIQLSHVLHHDHSEIVVGAVVECRVHAVYPTQGLLELAVVGVKSSAAEGDERSSLSALLRSGVVAGLDA